MVFWKKYSISRNILLSSILLAGVYCNRFFFFKLFFQKQLQSNNIIIKSDEPDKICYNDRYFISVLMRHQMISCVACRFYLNLSVLITSAFYVGWYIVMAFSVRVSLHSIFYSSVWWSVPLSLFVWQSLHHCLSESQSPCNCLSESVALSLSVWASILLSKSVWVTVPLSLSVIRSMLSCVSLHSTISTVNSRTKMGKIN